MTSPEITDAMVEAAALAYAKACGKCNRRGIRSALSAALAAGAPMSRVKPLEWRTRYFDAEVTIEQASAGTLYQIRDYKGRFWLDIGPDDVGYATLEAAKAAAQADYEARILSALEPAPAALAPTLPQPDTVSMSGGVIHLEYADADRRDAAYEWLEGYGFSSLLFAAPARPDVTALREALLDEMLNALIAVQAEGRTEGSVAGLVQSAILRCQGYFVAALAQSAAPVQPEPGFDETRAETAEAIVRSARDILNRLETYAPDVGVDEFCDALHDAHASIARIDGAE